MKVANFTYTVWNEYSLAGGTKWCGRVLLGDEHVLTVDLSEHKPYHEHEAYDALEVEFAKRLQAVLNG
jgi:hypothetical protein